MPQYIATGPNGERKGWNGEAWVSIPRADAKGLSYLPERLGTPDKSEASYFNAWRKEQDKGVGAAEAGISDARTMEGLLQKQETGGIYALPVIGSVAGIFDPEIRQMDAVQSRAARQNRAPGEGAISDFDAQQFLAMTYGKDKPTATNRALIQAQRIANDYVIQKRTFNDWYFQTYGNRLGADEAWYNYARANPIFDPNSQASGEPRLNAGRQNWRQYFGAVRGPGDAAPSVAQADIERAEGGSIRGSNSGGATPPSGFRERMTPQQLKAAAMFKGAKAKSGDRSNPWVPTNDHEFEQLPVGSYFINAADGRLLQKKR